MDTLQLLRAVRAATAGHFYNFGHFTESAIMYHYRYLTQCDYGTVRYNIAVFLMSISAPL